MFFGPPLTTSRSFDTIFHNAKSLMTLYHLYICYYSHFEGGVNACLSLFNAYLSRKTSILAMKAKQKEKRYDGNVFSTKKAVDYLKRFDDACRDSFVSVFSEFNNHS